MVGHKSFLLLQNEYPLEGSIDVSASCSLLPAPLREVTTGFWRLLSDHSVVRYWVRMVNGVIYETPQSDSNRTTSSIPTFTTNAENEPLFMIDISTICNRTVERETAIFSTSTDRRFCFYMDVVSFPRGSDVCEHKRFLVGVDSEAELIKWVRTINNIIDIIRNPVD
uniref:PH domain-containing protein n=1 Tax=Panagrellus redivivus TaxID=6233 RepID=A0A7E4UV80_PANRE